MYGQYRNSGIVRLYNYEQAKEWHDKTEPIRGNGRNAGRRPLGHRNKPQFHIVMQGEDVVCICYNTEVVTFHPDNTITVQDGGYISQTTANFINDVLWCGARIQDHDIILFGGTNPTRLMRKAVLRPDGHARYTVIETGKHYTHKLKRKRMNELRKPMIPFMRYAHSIIKIREGSFDNSEVVEAIAELGIDQHDHRLDTHLWNANAADRVVQMRKFYKMATEGSVENWYLPLLWLARSATSHAWSKIHVDPASLSGAVDDILIALHPDVLEAVETPSGTIKVDRYARFKPFIDLAKKEEA